MVHTARRDHSDGGRLSTPAQLTRSRGSAWFIGLTILTLGLYVYFGVLVVIDAGAKASEAAHLVGAIGCTAIAAAGLLPQLIAPQRADSAKQLAPKHRPPTTTPHWFMMAELGFAIPLVGDGGCRPGRPPRSWPPSGSSRCCSGTLPPSLGMRWGVLAVLTAVVYSVLSVVEIRPRRVQRTRVGAG